MVEQTFYNKIVRPFPIVLTVFSRMNLLVLGKAIWNSKGKWTEKSLDTEVGKEIGSDGNSYHSERQ
jgi:hypothetical protein